MNEYFNEGIDISGTFYMNIIEIKLNQSSISLQKTKLIIYQYTNIITSFVYLTTSTYHA